MAVIVKICGLSTRATLDAALESGADMVGFVFFAPSPRNIGLTIARELGRQARGATKVALTVDADDALLGNIVDALSPQMLQLHGSESVARVRDVKQKFGLPVMKALPIASADDLSVVPGYAAVADRILFDARAPKDATRPGGLGTPFDWRLLQSLDRDGPFMLSGGINAGNVAQALRVSRLSAVDVSSGVESAVGVKDAALIRAFVRTARASLASPFPERARSAVEQGEKAG